MMKFIFLAVVLVVWIQLAHGEGKTLHKIIFLLVILTNLNIEITFYFLYFR